MHCTTSASYYIDSKCGFWLPATASTTNSRLDFLGILLAELRRQILGNELTCITHAWDRTPTAKDLITSTLAFTYCEALWPLRLDDQTGRSRCLLNAVTCTSELVGHY